MRLAAILILFKERSFIEACVRAIYPVVDSICVVSQHDRNYSGKPIEPDDSLPTLLGVPDPDNKIRLVVERDVSHLPGTNSESRMRNAAMALDPDADYYLIVDSDEIWPADLLRQVWAEVQRTKWAAYRISSHTYFRKWNYRIVEPGDGYRPLVILRRGFLFEDHRQVNWRGPQRWREYLRTGRKPKTVYLPPEWRLHHGSCVGDDHRILNKIKNYGHASDIDPNWFDRVWKNFNPGIENFHYFRDRPDLYQRLITIPTAELPREIGGVSWPEGWIEKSASS